SMRSGKKGVLVRTKKSPLSMLTQDHGSAILILTGQSGIISALPCQAKLICCRGVPANDRSLTPKVQIDPFAAQSGRDRPGCQYGPSFASVGHSPTSSVCGWVGD